MAIHDDWTFNVHSVVRAYHVSGVTGRLFYSANVNEVRNGFGKNLVLI